MNFFKKIFGTKLSSTEKSEMLKKQETKPDISLLICSNCKKEYKIGKNAVAVCLEVSAIPNTTILIDHDNITERMDLVAPIDPSNKGAFERAKLGWETIQDSLSHGQQRKWKCNLCNQVNKYPDLSININELSNQNLSTKGLNHEPHVIVHTYPNSIAQRLLGLSADDMLSQTYLETSGQSVIKDLGLIGSPDALRFLNEILESRIYGKEIKGHAKRALSKHNKKTENINIKTTEVKYTYKCDDCSKEYTDSGGYVFYSDVPMMGNMLLCSSCTNRIISDQTFAAPRKHSGSFDLLSLQGNKLNELNAESIVTRCKRFGFTPSQAKQKAKELGLEFHKDNDHGQELAYTFWRSI
jgi:hypothetical protein